MKTQTEIDSILKDVQDRLDERQRRGELPLRIPQGAYLDDDPWLSVVVEPESPAVRAYDFVEILSDVESELRAAGIDHVLLVPAIAD